MALVVRRPEEFSLGGQKLQGRLMLIWVSSQNDPANTELDMAGVHEYSDLTAHTGAQEPVQAHWEVSLLHEVAVLFVDFGGCILVRHHAGA